MHKKRTTVGLLIAVLATAAAVCAAGATAGSARSAVVGDNPDLTADCGLNILLILDESGSIDDFPDPGSGGGTVQVRSAATTFLSALADTGSTAGIIEFNTQARSAIGATSITAASTQAGGAFHTYLNDLPDNNDEATGYDPGEYESDERWTNWDDAFLLAEGTTADLVVFITDGNPTAFNDDHNSPPENDGSPTVGLDGSTVATGLANAQDHANTIKAAGVHIFGVGVQGEEADTPDLANIAAVTGPDVYSGSNFPQADYTSTNFAGLDAALKEIATDLCQSSVTITKLVDEGTGGGYQPASGWQFSGNVTTSTATFSWVQPTPEATVNSPNSRSVTTAGDGTATFQWNPNSAGATSSISVNETLQAGYDFVSAVCTKDGQEIVNTTTLPFTVSGLGADEFATCEVRNKNPVVSTAVSLRSFRGLATAQGVELLWRTASERDVLGFNVWRGQKKVNRALVPAKAVRPSGGASYRIIDRTARAGKTYTYRLQVVDLDGARSWRGSARVRAAR